MMRRLAMLALCILALAAPCAVVWLVAPVGYKVFAVLVWFLGLLYLVAAFVAPDPVARHEGVVAGVPPAPATPQIVTFDFDAGAVTGTFAFEDDAATRTRLQPDDPDQ